MSVRLKSLDVVAWFDWAEGEDAGDFYPGPCCVVEQVRTSAGDYTRHTWSGKGVVQHDGNRRVVVVLPPFVEPEPVKGGDRLFVEPLAADSLSATTTIASWGPGSGQTQDIKPPADIDPEKYRRG